MPMIVGDELEADWKRVRVAQAPGDEKKYGNQDTDGSRSTRHFFEPMRHCGAAARTMLEAAACGTPCLALPLAENQLPQATLLAEGGAVQVVAPSVDAVLAAVSRLRLDLEACRELSRKAQLAVDGYGALRVAFHLQRLLSTQGRPPNRRRVGR